MENVKDQMEESWSLILARAKTNRGQERDVSPQRTERSQYSGGSHHLLTRSRKPSAESCEAGGAGRRREVEYPLGFCKPLNIIYVSKTSQ